MRNFFNDKMMREAPDALSPAAAAQVAPEPAAGPDLSFVPTDYHTDGNPDLVKFGAHYQDLVAQDAQRRESMVDVPEDGAYNFALPDDLKFDGIDVPADFKVDLDTEGMKPLYDELGAMLKELNAPQAAAGKVAGMIATYEAMKEARAMSEWTADMKTLGSEAQISARFGAVQRKLETMLPAADAKALLSRGMISAKGIQALEKLVGPKGMNSPVAQPNNNAELEGMSAFDRLKFINAKNAKAS
jgi:hypothetical protein